MRSRNWTTAIYDTEDLLGLYWRWELADGAKAKV